MRPVLQGLQLNFARPVTANHSEQGLYVSDKIYTVWICQFGSFMLHLV